MPYFQEESGAEAELREAEGEEGKWKVVKRQGEHRAANATILKHIEQAAEEQVLWQGEGVLHIAEP